MSRGKTSRLLKNYLTYSEMKNDGRSQTES